MVVLRLPKLPLTALARDDLQVLAPIPALGRLLHQALGLRAWLTSTHGLLTTTGLHGLLRLPHREVLVAERADKVSVEPALSCRRKVGGLTLHVAHGVRMPTCV